MAQLAGTVVVSGVVPTDSRDTYPTHFPKYGKGGHRSVQNLSEMNAIPLPRREVGMTVYVEDQATTYMLKGGTNNTNWELNNQDVNKFLNKDNNLADVSNKTESRNNLGLTDTAIAPLKQEVGGNPYYVMSQQATTDAIQQAVSDIKGVSYKKFTFNAEIGQSEFGIGFDLEEYTTMVYSNGVLLNEDLYSVEGGTISLANPSSNNDVVQIVVIGDFKYSEYLRKEGNLSELTDRTEARNNLGLTDTAIAPLEQVAGESTTSVMSQDAVTKAINQAKENVLDEMPDLDSYMDYRNNLGEIQGSENQQTARSNLGLSDASTMPVADRLGYGSNTLLDQKTITTAFDNILVDVDNLVENKVVNSVENVLNENLEQVLQNNLTVVENILQELDIEGYLQEENNLSDLENVEVARTNLGLGEAATRDVTDNLTTASDNDVVTKKALSNSDYLSAANNLSEVNPALARANLGITDSAMLETTTVTGTSNNKVMTQGAVTNYLNTKVDKVNGYGLSQENFTTPLKDKLAGLESSKYKGTYPSLSALQSAHSNPVEGSYADVDMGVGTETLRHIWDKSNNQWVGQAGMSTTLTGSQIKQMYEDQEDTNAFSDEYKGVLDNLEDFIGLPDYTQEDVGKSLLVDADSNGNPELVWDRVSGGGSSYEGIAAEPINELRAVWVNQQGKLGLVGNQSEAQVYNLIGVSVDSAQANGKLTVRINGIIEKNSWNLPIGRLYLGTNGTLVSTPPETGYHVSIGVATSAKTLFVNIQEPIKLN